MTRGVADGAAQRGVFITLEGPEGSGKTTQARRLAERATMAGLSVVLTREPGGTPVGERVREVLLEAGRDSTPIEARTDVLLFNSARAQLVAEVVEPALARGDLVICARFADSTVAYQGAGRGLPVAELREIEAFATGGLKPDRTILLDLPVRAGLRRKGADEQTRFETDFDLAFHERVRAGFLTMAAREPERFIVIDAGRGADEVFASIVEAMKGLPGLAALSPPTEPSVSGGPSGGAPSGRAPGSRSGSPDVPDGEPQRLGDLDRPGERMYA